MIFTRSTVNQILTLVLTCVISIALAVETHGQTLTLQRVASGLDDPVFATYAPGDLARLYIVERSGVIKILNLNTGTINQQNFLVVPNVSVGSERGLLGLAFHPQFQSNRRFYVNYTDDSGSDTRIAEYTATNANLANPNSERMIMEIDQPQVNHNGGWIGFADDGYLYIGTGDGGSSNDNGAGHTANIGNAQDVTNNLLGKILRIDIDGDDFPNLPTTNYAIPADNPFASSAGDDEIYVYGIRNPWRCSFDRENGDLYIADVGQGDREEITVIPSRQSGHNLGWRQREGIDENPSNVGGPRPAGAIDPVYDYAHGNGPFDGNSITGGYVYRGPVAQLSGHYFFADFVSDNIWSFQFDGSEPAEFAGDNFNNLTRWTDALVTDVGTVTNISSFAEDAAGNLYIIDFGGEIFQVVGLDTNPTDGEFGGNVTVNVRNGGLRVTGQNNTNQCIVVTATATPSQYLFSSVGQPGNTTTFNGQPSLLVSGINGQMRLDIGSGNKVLVLSDGETNRFNVPSSLRISSKGSDSVVIILDNVHVASRTDIRTRNGDDAVYTFGCRFNQRCRISSGNGDDVVVDGDGLTTTLYADDFDIRAGQGDDVVACFRTMVLDRLTPRLGNGNDGVLLSECQLARTTIFGNGGFDRFSRVDTETMFLSLRQIEQTSSNANSIESQLQDHPAFQSALSFAFVLGL